ncbi:hypothetical protein GCK32_002171 [Trichostrongylus colubriformis]|uniref:Uncharacterized protein n=1 Tax=Trichostrongylus colubriformis TaxID=6319 RepID=A0AAN8F950_TRICO
MVLSENFYYKVLSNGNHLLHTTIGDIVVNKVLDVETAITYTSFNEGFANPSHHEDLAELVSKFWKLEAVGIIDDPNQNDEECLNLFNNSVLYNDEERRYTVSLPFKINPFQLPDNYDLAYSRLCSQLRTLQQNPLYLEKYNAVIVDQLERRIIGEVPQEQLRLPSHYLPHYEVIKPDRNSFKVRCVYDGSARTKGNISLNDTLYRGPVLFPDLTGILLRTRFHRILIFSDIEKALDGWPQ